eukprot:TRINITY_DN101089_c0_g1_i1.p1 TRINITY_DN101089_c0_g1~~TRINITY_DN101089_c0_g1_i1.p1  ORF type:complete len:291 (-),score=57.75 TRINITY_DN101089_c0_g1_i1:99-905(-)
MARKANRSSFDRVFARQPGSDKRDPGEPPSVHELFAMAMRDELPLPQFVEALVELHGVRLTPGAARLLSSVDAASGRLSFSQFQKALQEGASMGQPQIQAGLPNVFQDQAHAIIADNCGQAVPPESRKGELGRLATDISKDPFVKAGQRIEKVQARGPFSGNVVLQTNNTSAGNPLANREEAQIAEAPGGDAEDPYGMRDMTRTATRMFVSGELDRAGYEKFLARIGLVPGPETDLFKLIASHERAGDGSFATLSRAVTGELARAGGS